jgi:hypothetical protein
MRTTFSATWLTPALNDAAGRRLSTMKAADSNCVHADHLVAGQRERVLHTYLTFPETNGKIS